jgi:hypothetical protein
MPGEIAIPADMFVHAVYDEQTSLNRIGRFGDQQLQAPARIAAGHIQVNGLTPERVTGRYRLPVRATGANQD